MLNTALLSRVSQKSQHTRYEEIILGRICCEEAPQFVPAWCERECAKDECEIEHKNEECERECEKDKCQREFKKD